MKKNIILIGPMGAGKTHIGTIIAENCGFVFYDSDQEIENRNGVPISWIFEQEGETGFRTREMRVIKSLTQLEHIVLATGGGSVIKAKNRHYLKQSGYVIYLKVSVEEQLKRTLPKKSKRPLLAGDNPREILEKLNRIREPLYQEIANITYLTDHFKPADLAKKILKDLAKNK